MSELVNLCLTHLVLGDTRRHVAWAVSMPCRLYWTTKASPQNGPCVVCRNSVDRGPVGWRMDGSWPAIWAALAAKPTWVRLLTSPRKAISWDACENHRVARMVPFVVNAPYELRSVARNAPRGDPEYAVNMPVLGGTSVPSSRPTLLDPRGRIKRRYGVVEWLTSSSSPPGNR